MFIHSGVIHNNIHIYVACDVDETRVVRLYRAILSHLNIMCFVASALSAFCISTHIFLTSSTTTTTVMTRWCDNADGAYLKSTINTYIYIYMSPFRSRATLYLFLCSLGAFSHIDCDCDVSIALMHLMSHLWVYRDDFFTPPSHREKQMR